MRTFVWIFGAALALSAVPATAGQAAAARPATDEAKKSSEKGMAALMQAMFKVEPLTAAQRDRLPQAARLVASIMPPGTMAQVMGGMYDKMLGPIMAMAGEASSGDIARELGVDPDKLELDDEEAARIAAILDPVWKERREAEMASAQRAMSSVLSAMEPGMRKGMAEAYAVNFTASELTDIERFFATSSGASFARKSYALASDPRIIAASMEALPTVLAQMKSVEADMNAASARFPPRRGYEDLTPAERSELSKLTGLRADAIREGMRRAAEARAKKLIDSSVE